MSFTGCEELMNGLGGLTGGEGISFSVESVEADGDGGTYEVIVTSALAWKATTPNNWITLDVTKGGTGQNYLSFKVAKNSSTSPRSGVITVSCEGYDTSAELVVNQEAGSGNSGTKDLTFDINVSDITAYEATISIVPSDKNEYYFWDIFDAAMIDQYGPIEVIVQAYYDYLKEMVNGGQISWSQVLSKGNDSYRYDGLTPATEYIVYTIHLDANGNVLSTNYQTERFTTAQQGNVNEATFAFSVSNITATSANISVTPSDANALYMWDLASVEELNSYFGGSIADYARAYYDMVKSYVDAGQLGWNNVVIQGVDSYVYEGLNPSTEYVLFAFQLDGSYNIVNANNCSTDRFITAQEGGNTSGVSEWLGQWELTSSKTYRQGKNASGQYEEAFLDQPLTRTITIQDSGSNDGTVLVYGWDGFFLNDAPALGVIENGMLGLMNETLVYNDGQGTMYQWLAQSLIPALSNGAYIIGGEYPAYIFGMLDGQTMVGQPYVGTAIAGDGSKYDFNVIAFTIFPVVNGDIMVWSYDEPVYTFAGDELRAVKVSDTTRAVAPKCSSNKLDNMRAKNRLANEQFSTSRFSSAVRFAKAK